MSRATPTELSDYPFRVLGKVRNRWFPHLRELRSSPGWKSGEAVVELEIRRDGSLAKTKLIQSAESNDLDAAASQAVTSAAPFPFLPETFPGNNMKLRLHFGYEQPKNTDAPLCNGPNWGSHTDARPLSKPIDGLTPPHPTRAPDPEYAEAARRMKYQSRVRLAGTVDPQGAFTDLCILVPAGVGLDEQAMRAVRNWQFEPATFNGQPTAVRINVQVDFRLY